MAKAKKGSKHLPKAVFWYFAFLAISISLALLYITLQANRQEEVLGAKTATYSGNIKPTGYKLYPTPYPIAKPNPNCEKSPVLKFAVMNPCGQSAFSYSTYTCGNNAIKSMGSPTSCKSVSAWYEYAKNECKTACKRKATPKPTYGIKPTCGKCAELSIPANYCTGGEVKIIRNECGCGVGFKCLTSPTPKPTY